MSAADVELVQKGYDAWNRRDLDGLLENFDDEVELHLPEGGLNSGTLRGLEEVRAFMESYLEVFEHLLQEPQRFIETADQIVVLIRFRGRGRASGVDVEWNTAQVWTIRAGKVQRAEVLTTWEQGLAVAGVSE